VPPIRFKLKLWQLLLKLLFVQLLLMLIVAMVLRLQSLRVAMNSTSRRLSLLMKLMLHLHQPLINFIIMTALVLMHLQLLVNHPLLDLRRRVPKWSLRLWLHRLVPPWSLRRRLPCPPSLALWSPPTLRSPAR
jgi:hypothetical protein